MRVVHVGLEATSTRSGGLNRYLEGLLAAQRAIGIDASAVVLCDATDETGTLVGLHAAGTTEGSALARAVRVDRAVRRLGTPDLCDLHFAGTAAVAKVVGSLRGVPTVVHFQGPWADESAHGGARSRNVSAKRAVERSVYRRADRAIVLSSAFATTLVERYGVAPWAIEVVAPGVDLAKFSPGDRDDARAVLGVRATRVVVAVRRLVPRMGIEILLEAWRAMSPRETDVLVVIGTGPEAAALHRLAESLGVAGTVQFRGRVSDDELVQWYRAADLTVVPSVALEGFGLVVLESLACGTPVVGTDADGLAEALESCGQVAVPAGDPTALAAAVLDALDATTTAATCRAIAERHGWEAVAVRHREIYDAVLSPRARTRVVVLDHTALLSGGELAIARALEAVRGDADVHAILAADGPLRARLVAAGVSVEVLELDETARSVPRADTELRRLDPRAAVSTARYVVRLARRLRALRPDVVHTNSLKAAVYGGVAARLAGVPCVWHIRDRIESPYLPSATATAVRLLARILPTVVVANSTSTLRTVVASGGRVVASPLDRSITPSPDRANRTGPVRFAVVGRLAPWKGQDLAIEAFAEAFSSGDETLRIVGTAMFGEDQYAEGLVALAASLGVADRVEFCGFVDDVAAEFARADVVIHASVLAEPFGQVVVEAMGAGCAVVVADAGGPADTVTDGVDGVVYAMGDRRALVAALRVVASDRALRLRLGAKATSTAAAYTPEALAPALLAAWDDAIGRRPRRGRRRG